jgi:Fe-S-cluster-containing hydrogenase component 2
MSSILYRKLQEQIDQYSAGFPATESGIEIQILERLFTEKEAEIFLQLGFLPEPFEAISNRVESDSDQVDALLDGMYKKGLVYRHSDDAGVKYGAVPFVEGIWIYQVKDLDRELARMIDEYIQEALHKNVTNTSPLLIHRPIAVNRTVDISHPNLTYENSRQIVQNHNLFAVTDCICRVQKGLIEEGCDKPLETCLMFGPAAKNFIDRGIGRRISKEEALHILEGCEEAGLVTMPFNTQSPVNICNCCPDCCIVLNNLKRYPAPAEMVKANHRAVVDSEKCEDCEMCSNRCPMDAFFQQEEGLISVNQDRCIGCGLCVGCCPADAIHLEVRSGTDRYEPPKTEVDFYMEMARMRGKTLFPEGSAIKE